MTETIINEETLDRMFDETITDEEYKLIRAAIKRELDQMQKTSEVVYTKKAIYEIHNDPLSTKMNIHYTNRA